MRMKRMLGTEGKLTMLTGHVFTESVSTSVEMGFIHLLPSPTACACTY